MKVLEFVAAHPFVTIILVGKVGTVATNVVGSVCRATVDIVSTLRTGKDPRVHYTKTTTFGSDDEESDAHIISEEEDEGMVFNNPVDPLAKAATDVLNGAADRLKTATKNEETENTEEENEKWLN